MSENKNVPYKVYFLEAVGLDLIKIGYANNIAGRMASLQTASPVPLRLLGTMPGGREMERFYHDCFAAQRVQGEWFKRSPELDGYIARADPPYVPSSDGQRYLDRERRYRTYRMRRENAASQLPYLPSRPAS